MDVEESERDRTGFMAEGDRGREGVRGDGSTVRALLEGSVVDEDVLRVVDLFCLVLSERIWLINLARLSLLSQRFRLVPAKRVRSAQYICRRENICRKRDGRPGSLHRTRASIVQSSGREPGDP